MTAKDSPAGAETIGNYDLLNEIAEGSMGKVYRARHWQTNQIVAVKVLNKDIARNPVLLKRFEQEFRITSKLDHPNVVKVLEYCGTGDTPFIVMEYVDGESLGEKLERIGRMSETDSLAIILQVAHGLHRAHRQGLIHRDIKPDNILVSKEGRAKVTDMGLAKEADANMDLTRTGRGLGTPNFMAPEQFRNAKNASIRCDIYSLGATLYQMVTGELPFGVTDPVQSMMRKLRNELPPPKNITPTLSERVDWAIRRAMSADPEHRPASCREFVEDLTGQSTRMDAEADDLSDTDDLWYLVFVDKEGMVRTGSGKTDEMRQALQAGKLGNIDTVRGSRSKVGPFELLGGFAEFRDLVVQPAPGPPLSERSAANLEQLGRLYQAASKDAGRPVVNSPAPQPATAASQPASPPSRQTTSSPNGEVPHFRVPAPSPRRSDERPGEWAKVALMIVLTVTATLLAVKYLIPVLSQYLK